MMKFQYNLPVNLIFGRGRLREAGSIAAPFGKKVLLVTGQGSARRTGLLDRTEDILKDAGLEWVLFDQVTQNPLTIRVIHSHGLLSSPVLGVSRSSLCICATVVLSAKIVTVLSAGST